MKLYTNYLNYKEQLIQIAFNYYTIILILVLLKVFIFRKSLLHALDDLEYHGTQSLDTINRANLQLVQLPHQYSQLVNVLVQQSIADLKSQWLYLLVLLINVIIGIVRFQVQLFIGTFVCLVDGLLQGVVDLVLDLVQEVVRTVNDLIQKSTKIISSGLDGLTKVINGVTNGINLVSQLFSDENVVDSSSLIDDINGAIDSLNNFSLPLSIYTTIEGYKEKVPSLDEVENDAIDGLKRPLLDLISTFNSLTLFQPLNTSVTATVPPYTKLSTETITDFTIKSRHLINKTFVVIMVLLILGGLAAMVVLAWKEYRLWTRKYEFYVQLDGTINDFTFLNLLNAYTNQWVYYTKKWFLLSDKTVWIISFVTSKYSLALLGLGLTGMIATGLQYWLFVVFNACLDQFPLSTLTTNVNRTMANTTQIFIDTTNDFITDQQKQLNDEMFGSIKNVSTVFSDAIEEFVQALNETLIEPFENTPLATPINTVVYCVVTRKLIMVERGLEWLEDNLVINLPSLPPELGQQFNDLLKNQATTSISLQPYIDKTRAMFKDSLIIEISISGGILGLWLLQLILGALYFAYRRTRDITISEPRSLTALEGKEYGYPFTGRIF